MVRKLLLAILIIAAVVAAFYFGYWFKGASEPGLGEEEGINNQPAAVPAKTFEGPTSSPSGIKGPSGPPPGQ